MQLAATAPMQAVCCCCLGGMADVPVHRLSCCGVLPADSPLLTCYLVTSPTPEAALLPLALIPLTLSWQLAAQVHKADLGEQYATGPVHCR